MLIIAEQDGLSISGRRAIARANQGSRVALTDLKTGNNAIKGGSTEDKPKSSLPSGVEVINLGQSRFYDTNIDGRNLTFSVNPTANNKGAEISFAVDEKLSVARNSDPVSGTKIATTVSQIMKHEATTRPDGFVFKTSAYVGDGLGDSRNALYARAGFSLAGRTGGNQFAVVKNGRLVPARGDGTPFTPERLAMHRTMTRDAIRAAAKDRRAARRKRERQAS